MKSLRQVETTSLRERVLDTLRKAIINGELKPGEILVETELAAQLGVSRAPLREAIRILNVEGLLQTVAYHGTTVKKLSRKDIEELYSVRGMIEVFAIRQIIAAEDMDAIVQDLRDIHDTMMAFAKQGSMADINWVDRKFHDALVKHTGNGLLMHLWESVSLRVEQVMALRNQKQGDLLQIAFNHGNIIDAIAAKNTDEAVRLIREHIGTMGDELLSDWHDDFEDTQRE
ncbi:MAG: GntR family transcriptional regulator [Chloroflexota bacterium]